jgi:hypothetical protein
MREEQEDLGRTVRAKVIQPARTEGLKAFGLK